MAKHDPTLSALFHALGDATRRDMLERLALGPAAVTDLAQPTGLALPTVLRHLAVLEAAGLIETQKTGRTRHCRALPDRLAPATDWLARQRRLWEERLDRLDAFLATLPPEEETPDAPQS